MKSATSIDELSNKIEQLVTEHLAATRAAASAAVRRAFGVAEEGRAGAKRPRPGPARESGGRRSQEQVAQLGERLYQAVSANPGETMTVLAAQIGASPRELNRPMTLLKRAGRLRSVGERSLTRYFPATGRSRATG
jgi:hypothetical protein